MRYEGDLVELNKMNVIQAREKDIEMLRLEVNDAYNHRVPISLWQLLFCANLHRATRTDDDNGVWVENPYLYSVLVHFALQKCGCSGEVLRDTVREIVAHECQHLIPIIGASYVQARLGIRFYYVARFPSLDIYQPELQHWGEISPEEEIDMITNVKGLSRGDKVDLKKIRKAARKR